jgi:uncharacterized protein YdiU (UPF0061 family)
LDSRLDPSPQAAESAAASIAAGRRPDAEASPGAAAPPRWPLENSYARALPELVVRWKPAGSPAPRPVWLNRALAVELGLDPDALAGAGGLAVLAGNAVPEGAEPIAQAYAGHQFGGFSPQLGDGRALLLGELIDRHGRRRDLAFKGSGRTPFSRNGDGKAALGPMLREVVIGEAMHALGIPTTRALAVVATGEPVFREQVLPGAMLARVAASHLRVGTFEFAATRGDTAQVRRLADYAIARHDPQLAGEPDRYLGLLQAVIARQAALIARWMGVGFIHGVMNTDNMTISGETIDFGPCAFLETYDPATVFSSIDTNGRYAYRNQPGIAQWNLARFAETLLPLIDDDADRAVQRATDALSGFAARYGAHWQAVLRAKLGLAGEQPDDAALADAFLTLLEAHGVDFTLGFRRLVDAAAGDAAPLAALFADDGPALAPWLARWQARAQAVPQAPDARLAAMRRANPVYIPRNHRVEAALAAASEHDDLAPLERLLAVLAQPFDERDADAEYAEPAAAELTAGYQTFCGT